MSSSSGGSRCISTQPMNSFWMSDSVSWIVGKESLMARAQRRPGRGSIIPRRPAFRQDGRTTMADLFDSYPYKDRFAVNRALPEEGRSREEILTELRTMALEEDRVWESGRCSGTM